jgi:hypothetical protein
MTFTADCKHKNSYRGDENFNITWCRDCGALRLGVSKWRIPKAQSSVEYRFKGEELARKIYKADFIVRHKTIGMSFDALAGWEKEIFYAIADSIISAGPTLLEVVKKEGL